ncbi:hypothetical protein ABZS79_12840 [Streptomyces griseoloalbus]|uniref:hypothetical protein n=1 Tax=Streptomyces griseoloalbus TaxID=67303 RepID=UPI0033AA9EF5
MSENSTATTDLTSQYTAQVANDLERNVKEQERVGAEIAALQEQLTVLQHDHTILVNMQQALGLAAAPAGPAAAAGPVAAAEPVGTPEAGTVPDRATVPAPRRRSGAKSGADKPKRAKKAGARTTSGKSARKPSAEAERPEAQAAKADGPKLVELVRRHLGEQSEPRSAAEVAAALGQAHPERTIRATVVRSTLEGLVARNQAQRSKQGSSVFYTAPDSGEGSPAGDAQAQS